MAEKKKIEIRSDEIPQQTRTRAINNYILRRLQQKNAKNKKHEWLERIDD